MAQEQDNEEQALYLTSLQSGSTTQPRFSDISRPSDGNIQVERLRLTPVGTGHTSDGKEEEEQQQQQQPQQPVEDDTVQPASPYPAGATISLLNTIENLKKISRESFINTNNISKNNNNNNTKKKHSHLAFRKSRNKDGDNNNNTINNTIKHDRGNSLGTIQSNAGTIGTMDVREYHENIRPHITDKKNKHTKSPMTDPIHKINEDDAASEIPPLPHSTQIQPIQPTPIQTNNNKKGNKRDTNMSTSVQNRQSNKNKGNLYSDDRNIDINNIQFDDEVDLTGPVTLTHHPPRPKRLRSTTNESRRSVRFHDASRNTFLSPQPQKDEEEVVDFPEVSQQQQGQIASTGAPMRFRGPARIALLHKYVPTDPFEGDTEIMQWSVGDVKIWISNLQGGVNAYANNFVGNHIKGQDLLRLTNEDLYHNLGVKSVGHRQIIMAAINELKKCVIVEINVDRFLVPPSGAVMRFEDVSVQKRMDNEFKTILGHVTGTFLPNQITAIMGDKQKSLLLKVLSGCGIDGSHHISGHIFINGNPIDGSLVNAGLASYINGDYSYSNFNKTTVSDLVKFYVKLSGSNKHKDGHVLSDASFDDLVNHVLRISDINYPKRTKISELKAIQYKRLMIAIDTILYDIKLIFLDKILDGLTQMEMIDMMQMIYSFSRRLDITFILSVERIRYHILNAYFDQVIVVGGIDAQKIVNDCTNYYKNADLVIQNANGMDMEEDDDDNVHYMNYEHEQHKKQVHNDLIDSATSIRFVGRPEDVMEYFRLKGVEFVTTENPIEVIFEHVIHNFELIEPELEEDYFRYRKKSNSLSPFTALTGPRNSKWNEMYIVTQFILMIGWREWSLFYSCLRIILYCLIVGTLFWDVSCEKYFLNERLLAIFVISCIPIAAVYPMLEFHSLHRDFVFKHLLFPHKIRQSSYIIALIVLCCTHSIVIGLFSFIPWLMEDLGANDTIAFIRIGFMQFMAAFIYGMIALFGAEIFSINNLRIISLFCTSSVLFAGALVHAGDISNRPGTVFIGLDFLKYSLEFLLYTDVDYILSDDACSDYLQSLKDRQFYDREFVDIIAIFLWIFMLIFLFSFTMRFQLSKILAYSSQFMIGRLSYKQQNELDIPYDFDDLGVHRYDDDTLPTTTATQHAYSATSLTSLGAPTPIHSGLNDPQIPVLPLNITPLSQASHISHGTGAFARIGSTLSAGTPTTPLHLSDHTRSDSDARFKVVTMLKQPSIDSYTNPSPIIINNNNNNNDINNNNNNNNNNNASFNTDDIPYENPALAHRRARSGNRLPKNANPPTNTITTNQSTTSIQTNPSTSSTTSASHHQHQISLSGLETIREKKAEENLPAVPPTTSDSLLMRQQHINTSGTVPPNVKILSTRASMVSHPGDSSQTVGRYSAISAFTPLRQQSLIGRMSFSNRRRSSVNMKSQAVPRFLAISPAQSFANSQQITMNQFPSHTNLIKQQHYVSGKDSMLSNKRLMASASMNAVSIPFDDGYDHKEVTFKDDEMNMQKRLSTVPSQETVTVPRMSEKLVIDDFNDKDFEKRMKMSPLIFYDLVIVNKYKQLLFNKVSGHAVENGVSVLLAASDIDCTPILRSIAGIYCNELLYVEGKIVVRGKELLTEMKLAQNRIIAYVPKDPTLPDLITVQEIVRLAFILTENEEGNSNDIPERDNVTTILKTMELTNVKDMRVSQLSRLDYLKVSVAYCGLRSVAGIVLIENIYSELNIIEQKQLIRCIHRLSQIHKLSILTCMYEITLESVQQDYINHIILLASIYNNGVSPIYEGTILESLQIIPKIFTFRKYENVIDEILDISCKTDTQSMQKLILLMHDLRQSNYNEMISLNKFRQPMNMSIIKQYRGKNIIPTRKKWLEYWWLGWLYWKFVSNHRILFFYQIFKIFVYVLIVCLAFWNLPSTYSGSKSMFGAMNALLFIFIMQTPANHRLFLSLLNLGIQDWQSGKYSLNMMSTLHCWSQYLLSIVLATITSILSYWAVNFNDPATAMGYSIILFTMGFVYSAGVWDSIYFLLFSCGCNQNLSFFIMIHLLLYFWLFSGCFILKTSMPLLLRYVGYYANPVRLTLESQYCAIILPKTFGNNRGSDILAKSDYDCAIGFDLCLVFLITFILRIIGSFILSYRYESIPLYNNSMNKYMNNPNNDVSDDGSIQQNNNNNINININNISDPSDDDDDDDDDDGQPANVPLVKSRVSKEDQNESKTNEQNNNNNTSLNVPLGGGGKRKSRHKQHSSVNHIPVDVIGSINFSNSNDDHYVNMDNMEQKQEKKSLINSIKNIVGNKLKKNKNENNNDNDGIGMDDMNVIDDDDDDDETDSELRNLENEYAVYSGNNNNESRVKYGNDNNNYRTMVLGTGADDSDDMLGL